MRRRTWLIGALAAVLVTAGCGSAEGLVDRAPKEAVGAITEAGGVVVTAQDLDPSGSYPSDPVPVVLYADLQCPACKDFDQTNGSYLDEQLSAGRITLEYRVIAFLDDQSTTRYSTRAANAALCVQRAAGPVAFHDFVAGLLEDQPAEGGAGLDDAELADRAAQVDADQARACITGESLGPMVEDLTTSAESDVPSVPTVVVDEEEVDSPLTPESLGAAIGISPSGTTV